MAMKIWLVEGNRIIGAFNDERTLVLAEG